MAPLPNRLAVYASALGALALGLLPLVGNLDWTSTAGVLGAIAAIAAVVSVWLLNWGKYERGEGDAILPDDDVDLEPGIEDDFDETTAEPVPAAISEAAYTPDPDGTTLAPTPATPTSKPGPASTPKS